MSKTGLWFLKEMAHLLPIILYFAICFNLFHFAQGLMLEHRAAIYTSYLGASVGAILAGKVILMADAFPLINAFPNKPIIWNIIWKFCLYGLVVLLVQFLDHYCRACLSYKSASLALGAVIENLTTPLFWGIQIFVMAFFLVFIIFSELTRVMGKAKLLHIFFG